MTSFIPADDQDFLNRISERLSDLSLETSVEDNRKSWDELSAYRCVDQETVGSLIELLGSRLSADLGRGVNREVAMFMQSQSSKYEFFSVEQMEKWTDIAQLLIERCESDHAWRYEYGAEWGHDALNSLCGIASAAAILPVLVSTTEGRERAAKRFFILIESLLGSHIENDRTSHSESMIAALAPYSLWINRIDSSWFLSHIMSSLDVFEQQTAHAFWQGFLAQRKWDMQFLNTTEFPSRIVELLTILRAKEIPRQDYFGRDEFRAFGFLLTEMFLRTPPNQQLDSFFDQVIYLELNSPLLEAWIDSIGFAIQKIDSAEFPTLADTIYVERFEKLISKLKDKNISPRIVGFIFDAIVGFREKFSEAFELILKLTQDKGCEIPSNSRMLMWLNEDPAGTYHVAHTPALICRLINGFLLYSRSDKDYSDMQLAEFIEKFGRTLTTESGLEFESLKRSIRAKSYFRSQEQLIRLFGDPNAH